jgi:limonene-1,2-epoxide hydrolase
MSAAHDSSARVWSEQELADFCGRYMAALNAQDVEAILAFYHDDVVWHDPALPAPARGISEVRAFLEGIYAGVPDLRVEEPDPPHRSASGSDIAWAWRTLGTIKSQPGTEATATIGHRVDLFGVDLWQMRGERIAIYRGVYDLSSMMGTVAA